MRPVCRFDSLNTPQNKNFPLCLGFLFVFGAFLVRVLGFELRSGEQGGQFSATGEVRRQLLANTGQDRAIAIVGYHIGA